MSYTKAEADIVGHCEREAIQQEHRHHDAVVVQGNEDKPSSVYQLGWKTMLALTALSLANSCAAVSNIV